MCICFQSEWEQLICLIQVKLPTNVNPLVFILSWCQWRSTSSSEGLNFGIFRVCSTSLGHYSNNSRDAGHNWFYKQVAGYPCFATVLINEGGSIDLLMHSQLLHPLILQTIHVSAVPAACTRGPSPMWHKRSEPVLGAEGSREGGVGKEEISRQRHAFSLRDVGLSVLDAEGTREVWTVGQQEDNVLLLHFAIPTEKGLKGPAWPQPWRPQASFKQ